MLGEKSARGVAKPRQRLAGQRPIYNNSTADRNPGFLVTLTVRPVGGRKAIWSRANSIPCEGNFLVSNTVF
jgi:hypothetical protein